MHYCVNLSGHLSSQHVLSLSFQAHLANNHVFLCQTETNFSMGWRQFWLRTWPFWITLGDFCWLLIFQPILAFLRAFVKFGKPLQWISHPSLIIIFPKFLINSQFTWEQYQLTPYKNLFQDKFVSVMKNCVNVSGLPFLHHVLALSFQAHLSKIHVFLYQTETNFLMGLRQFWPLTYNGSVSLLFDSKRTPGSLH